MRHEKIFKRADGTQYKIDVNLLANSRSAEFDVGLETRAKGKRKWTGTSDSYVDTCEFRELNWEERGKFHKKKYLDHVTAEEILSVKLELWEMIKPKLEG